MGNERKLFLYDAACCRALFFQTLPRNVVRGAFESVAQLRLRPYHILGRVLRANELRQMWLFQLLYCLI